MVKLTKYLKPFALSIAAVIVLLFAQAQCELALPDYMADIVDVGIQTGGIHSAIPEVIRQSEAEKLSSSSATRTSGCFCPVIRW